MVDRIRQLLQARQLSPTQFADTIGVARPIVSHILGGRNKPSLEVVQKIIAAFPDIAMPWLLTGQGPMLTPATEATTSSDAATASPVAPESVVQPRRVAKASRALAGTTAESTAPAQLESPVEHVVQAPQPPIVTPPLPAEAGSVAMDPIVMALAQSASPAKPPRTIRRVMVFYSDGTFADFSPSADGL
ncbi:helix-turn-helix domain-containing protein [Hymenobacter jeollabukensis]|uniref:Helix-turn-helix domain-containing protein n=1 Tax=Hymenobacter jeollabukensis TaxID=2025313 RepID=A0A5R8WP59_9BACT|nr:helix-turn-helix domain-containing protein [Hymenobacter jeollabukensis]